MSFFDRIRLFGKDDVNPVSPTNPLVATLVDQASGKPIHVSHFGLLKAGDTKPIVSGNFDGDKLRRFVWVPTQAGSGFIDFEKGVAKLHTGAAASSSYQITSRREGRFVAGQVTVWQSGVHPKGGGVAGNMREWGLCKRDGQQALLFRLNGTDLEIVAKRDGVETIVPSANFSAKPGYTVSDQNKTWRIEYSAGRALFYDATSGDKSLIHEMVDTEFPLVNGLGLAGHYKNENDTNTTDVELRIRGFSISVWSQLPLEKTLFQYATPDDDPIPSGAPYSVPAVPDVSPPANVRDSGWIPRNEFLALFTQLKSDTSLEVYVMNASDQFGNNIEGNVVPNIVSTPGFPSTISAMLFDEYVRVVVVNVSGSTANNVTLNSRALETPVSPIFISLDQPLFDFFPVVTTQAVIKGKNVATGLYNSVQLSARNSLLVATGERQSELFGRTPLTIDVDQVSTQTVLVDLLTEYPGKKFFMTDINIDVENQGWGVTGRISVSDVGTPKVRHRVSPRSVGSGVNVNALAVNFPDPREFLTNVRLDFQEGAGKVFVSGTIGGYLEDI